MSSKLPKRGWEIPKDDLLHLKENISALRDAIRFGLQKKYKGLAESMFRYEWNDDPAVQDMLTMSQDTVPELFLMKNGQCVWFEYLGDLHCLPPVYSGGNNMYGKMSSWSPMPVGYGPHGSNDALNAIRDMKLDSSNSVLMKNDLFGGNDELYIDAMISELVDNTLTMNQLQMIAKNPMIFNVTEDNYNAAKLFYVKMASDEPVIFTNRLGDDITPVLEPTNCPIDPALFELFDRFECQILEYLGFPCVPISKRAQQSVSEVQSNDEKITLRRKEKLHQREQAIERINAMFGKTYKVISVIDEMQDERRDEMQTIGEEVNVKNRCLV